MVIAGTKKLNKLETSMTLKRLNVLSCLLVLLVQTAQAHTIWVAQRADQHAIVLGEGGMDNRYDSDNITQVFALDKDGKPVSVTPKATKQNVVLDIGKSATLVSAIYDAGVYTKDKDDKWHQQDKTKVANPVESTQYTLLTTTLLDHQETAVILPALPLQITAMSDPFALKKGGTLPVMVSFMGKPLADAEVIVDFINDPDGVKVKTDKDGMANITIASNGVNVLKVSHKHPRKDTTQADVDGYAASLAFNLWRHH